MTLLRQMDGLITLAQRRGLRMPMVAPVRADISDECNKGHHFDCSGCRCQCHGGSPGWSR